ncbi:hypothetical protein L6164_000487 [Bauhinia variegata]|uniref:Uncharacterized protein n=1 Tax=Bauhinia variegata TaxID=167791 RepID=A0ACB9QCD4_BAUVA|nr:hypothetical protein L6164_000487 [Bauhinia variegata]
MYHDLIQSELAVKGRRVALYQTPVPKLFSHSHLLPPSVLFPFLDQKLTAETGSFSQRAQCGNDSNCLFL